MREIRGHRGNSRRVKRGVGALAFAALAILASAVVANARSLALVVGNDAYVNVTALKTAVGDARSVGDQLEKMGFVVRRALNLDQRAMSRALAAFNAELQPGDRALFSTPAMVLRSLAPITCCRPTCRPPKPIRSISSATRHFPSSG